jgi:predicted phosphodiesterase
MSKSSSNAKRLSIAIVSDLHCCAPQEGPRKSFLIAGSKRTPIGQHLVQSLLALIDKHKMKADVVICPGDLSHQVCQAGMVQAWEYLGEIQRKLGSPELLATVGNHDVDSRKLNSADAFDLPKTFHPDFPRPDSSAKDMFWGRGFYQAQFSDTASFVVLNTVIKHIDHASAERGTFDISFIEGLKQFLDSNHPDQGCSDPPIRVGVMHHHPIVHSTAHFGSTDVLEFGDQLLDVLGEFGYQFIIHGHRHEPRITRHQSQSLSQLVFAAGSFSAQLGELASRTKNLFHHVELEAEGAQSGIVGRIRTWEFTFGVGWQEATEQSARLPYESALVSPMPTVQTDILIQLCDQCTGGVMRLPDIQEQCPQLLKLLPSEVNHHIEMLRSRGYKLLRDEQGQIIQIGKVYKP